MIHENPRHTPEHEPRHENPNEYAGIYREERKRAEREFILERLRRAHVSTKGLDALRTLMETTTSLDELQGLLTSEKDSFDDESFSEISRIIREIRSLSESDLKKLKAEILHAEEKVRTNPDIFVSIDEVVYPSHTLKWVKRLETSPLGENLLLDAAGLAVGAMDSGYAVLRLLVDLLIDLARLPVDIASMLNPDARQ
ncbi:MAG TPA: hypothetical protein PK765_01240 [bacterium]|nr:hypothetical protein [bacterium]